MKQARAQAFPLADGITKPLAQATKRSFCQAGISHDASDETTLNLQVSQNSGYYFSVPLLRTKCILRFILGSPILENHHFFDREPTAAKLRPPKSLAVVILGTQAHLPAVSTSAPHQTLNPKPLYNYEMQVL